jgi:aryl-alcohol dehydrogenase-like predicted oxidoreductase
MLMRKLGRTGLKVAALCLGGNTFGWTTDQQASEAVLDAYLEQGGNFVDTADVYSRWVPGNSGGESEGAATSLAGFQPSTTGRFWVSTEGEMNESA